MVGTFFSSLIGTGSILPYEEGIGNIMLGNLVHDKAARQITMKS